MRDAGTRITSAVHLGAAIKQRRRELGYTQREVAEFNRCSIRFISELERGMAGANFRQVLLIVNSLGLDLFIKERGESEWR